MDRPVDRAAGRAARRDLDLRAHPRGSLALGAGRPQPRSARGAPVESPVVELDIGLLLDSRQCDQVLRGGAWG